jgi:bacteriocin-like protein
MKKQDDEQTQPQTREEAVKELTAEQLAQVSGGRYGRNNPGRGSYSN